MTGTQVLAELALANPDAALALADTQLATDTTTDARIEALHARGLALREKRELGAAAAELVRALNLATTAASDRRAACALSLGATYLYQGRLDEGIELLENCATTTSGLEQAEARFQLGTGYARIGQFDKTLVEYAKALPVIRRHGHHQWEAHLLGNRGAVHLDTGRYQEALRDLDSAILLNERQDDHVRKAWAQRNKAETLLLLGDIPGSFDLYESADPVLEAAGVPTEALADKAHTLMAAGFFRETLDLTQKAFTFQSENGNAFGQLNALVPAVEAALAVGEDEIALRMAALVDSIDGADAYPMWTARVDLGRLRALARLDSVTQADVDQAVLRTSELGGAFGAAQKVGSAIAVARVAVAAGDYKGAVASLDAVGRTALRAPAHVQIERWTMLTELRSAGHDERSAKRAIRAGLRCFGRLVDASGSYEVRASAGRHALSLAQLSVEAFDGVGEEVQLVDVLEHLRSNAIGHRSQHGSDNSAIRQLTSELAASEAALLRDIKPARAPQQIRDEIRAASRSTTGQVSEPELRASDVATNEQYLVWAEHGDALHRIEVRPNGVDRYTVDLPDVVDAAERQAFAARQLAQQRRLSARAQAELSDQHRTASADLDRLLLSDMTLKNTDRHVLNPSQSIRQVSWGALPTLTARPHVVAPALHVTRRPLPRRNSRVVVMGSSELAHVPAEVTAVASSRDVDASLDPAAQLVATLDGAGTAHIAGHFIANGSNPLFSSIPLGEHTLFGHEVLAWRRAPRLTVLSACSSGRSEEVGAAEMGFATSLLAAGGSAVIASQTPVEDGTTVALAMTELHRLLASGQRPADALATLRTNCSAEELPLIGAFFVLGAGW